jgi:hypothetical protein
MMGEFGKLDGKIECEALGELHTTQDQRKST